MENFFKFGPVALFCAYFARVGVLGATYPDAIALLVFGALLVLREKQLRDKRLADLQAEVAQFKTQLAEHKKEISEIRSYVNGQKLGTMRVQHNVRSV